MHTKTKSLTTQVDLAVQPSALVKGKFEMSWLRFRVFLQLFRIVLQKTGKPLTSIKSIYRVKKKYESVFGEGFIRKAAKVDGRYYWRLAAPGFPSQASWTMQFHEVNRYFPEVPRKGLRSLIFSITNKCPLKCEHCLEWDNLNQEEKLTSDELIGIIHKYQDFGTTQMMLSGGEPMLRIHDIFKILNKAMEGTDFWIITSGIGLTIGRAKKLKQAGLTGVMVSLDHFDRQEHNWFRGFEDAYNSAISAALHSNEAGLVTALSLCVTKSFVNRKNLINYMELAKNLGVSFVQLLEPRATGRYKGKDVALGEQQLKLLEQIYLEYNSSPVFTEYPIIHYLGYHQRRSGCFGAGDRFFYIDTQGEAHICPFCAQKIGSALHYSSDEMIEKLGQRSCHLFKKNSLL